MEAGTRMLVASKGKLWRIVLLCLVFAFVGALMARSGKAAGWFVLGVFGIGGLTLMVQLLPGPQRRQSAVLRRCCRIPTAWKLKS